MTAELITLPIRWGVRATSLALRGGEEIASLGLALAVEVVGRVRGAEPPDWPDPPSEPSADSPSEPSADPPSEPSADSPSEPTPTEPIEPTPSEPSAATPAEPNSRAPLPDRGPVIDLDARDAAVPEHVSEETTLAAEVAEPGAEEGAGAEIHVDEPWPGYVELHADDVIERVSVSDPAELAAIQLFESAHQRRQTVLSAVQRALELAARN